MRKNILKTMVVIGAAALLLPTAAMAEWEQGERHENQEDHGVLAIDHTLYGMESGIGYDFEGDGMNTSKSIYWTSKNWGAPLNTTPCPINLADPTAPFTWEEAAGKCPSQLNGKWDSDQTGSTAGYASDDVELFGVILDDLYQSLSEEAVIDQTNTKAFKKVTQVLDILFYRSNTAGEAFGVDGWKDTLGEAGNATAWFGGIGMDQTLDQDVADVYDTTSSPNGTADRWSSDPNKLWKYDHVAQTFYQDFRLWDRGNTFGVLNTDGSGGQTVDSGSAGNIGQNYSPRMRHGMELLALCKGTGACTNYGIDSNMKVGGEYVHLYTTDLSADDFAFFDQWVIQSMKDSYTYADLAADLPTGNDPDAGFDTAKSKVELLQSYSSWMVQGAPGDLCDSINNLTNSPTSTACRYTYDKKGHEVVKDIPDNTGKHQTGDP